VDIEAVSIDRNSFAAKNQTLRSYKMASPALVHSIAFLLCIQCI